MLFGSYGAAAEASFGIDVRARFDAAGSGRTNDGPVDLPVGRPALTRVPPRGPGGDRRERNARRGTAPRAEPTTFGVSAAATARSRTVVGDPGGEGWWGSPSRGRA